MKLPGVGDVCLAWASTTAVPEGDGWLTPAEAAILGRFRMTKRAADWRLGRWVAKEAVAQALGGAADGATGQAWPGTSPAPLSPSEVEILAGPGGGPRARVLAPGVWPSVSVSLSHSAGVGFAVAALGEARLGCDVEEIALRSDKFVADYFTEEEAAWIRAGAAPGEEGAAPAHAREVRANLLWSAKESALKALGEGLRKDTRSVVVDVQGLDAAGLSGEGGTWQPLVVASGAAERFAGWWRLADGFAWTVVG